MLAGGCGWPPACIRGKPRMQAVKRLKESRAGRIVREKRKGDRINAEIASATKVPVPRAQKIARRYRGVRPADIVHSRPMGRPASTLPGQEGALNRPVRQGPAQARGAQDREARGNTCPAQRRTQGVAGRGTGPEESEKAEARVGHARAQALKLDVACGLRSLRMEDGSPLTWTVLRVTSRDMGYFPTPPGCARRLPSAASRRPYRRIAGRGFAPSEGKKRGAAEARP